MANAARARRLDNAKKTLLLEGIEALNTEGTHQRQRISSAEAAKRQAARNLSNNFAQMANYGPSRYLHPSLPLEYRDEDLGAVLLEPKFTPDFWGEMEKAYEISDYKSAKRRKRSAEAHLRSTRDRTVPFVSDLVQAAKQRRAKRPSVKRAPVRRAPARRKASASRAPVRRRRRRA